MRHYTSLESLKEMLASGQLPEADAEQVRADIAEREAAAAPRLIIANITHHGLIIGDIVRQIVPTEGRYGTYNRYTVERTEAAHRAAEQESNKETP